MAGPQSHAPLLEVRGSPLAQKWLGALTAVRVDRSLNLVGRASLRFVDAGYALSSSGVFELGTEVVVKHRSGVLFSGDVTAVGLEQSTHRVPELVVTVSDKAAKLAARSHSRAFLNQTLSGVVTTLVSGTGLTASCSGPGTAATHEYLLQAGNDLAYLDTLASRAGLVWSVDARGTALSVAEAGDASTSVPLELGKDLEDFSVRATASGADKVTVTGWGEADQLRLVGEATTSATAESTFVEKAAGRRRGSASVLVTNPPPRDTDEATMMARAMLAEATSSAVVATGTCPATAALGPGVAVRVAHAGPASGTYFVTRVEHLYGPTGFRTRFTAGPHRPSGMVDLLAAPRTDPGFTASGVLPAIVSGLDDPEKMGRVKVEFTTVSGTVASAWARTVAVGGGPGRGMVFHPEVQDEVLVAFEQSDVRRPVVIGGLYSKKKALPGADFVADDKVMVRRITSRLGHVVELADGTGDTDQHVLIKLGNVAHRIRLGTDRLDVETDGKPVRITDGTAFLELDGTGKIKIQGTEVSIKATTGAVTVEAGGKLSAKGNGGVAVQGPQVDIKGDASAKVEAGASLVLKGATVAIN